MKKRRAIVSVINDLVTDRRVHRTCMLLHEMGFDVLLVGRIRRGSLPLDERIYRTWRMRLLFEKGPLFYACFNIRLLLFLLLHRADLYFSNDLDTLLPNFLISRIKRKPLIYDSHEYFTGVPELTERPRVRKVWKCLERRLLPRIRHMATVNDSIAKLYQDEYGVNPVVVRNVPERTRRDSSSWPTRNDLGLPAGKRVLILQGAGINIQRGTEEAVEAMKYVDDTLLLIIGGGDVIGLLKSKVSELNLQDRVRFIPKLPMQELLSYTRLADGGLTLDKDTNINYRYSLPNKLFDYIHAGIPVLASDLPEIRMIILRFDIGLLTKSHDPEELSIMMKKLLFDEKLRSKWMENLPTAATALCWEKEKPLLRELIEKATPK